MNESAVEAVNELLRHSPAGVVADMQNAGYREGAFRGLAAHLEEYARSCRRVADDLAAATDRGEG